MKGSKLSSVYLYFANGTDRQRTVAGPPSSPMSGSSELETGAAHSGPAFRNGQRTRTASALLSRPDRGAEQALLAATAFGRRVNNSNVQPQPTALEISLLLLEERQQLLENLIPMPVDFAVECVTKARRMGMDCFPVCRDFRRRSAEVYPAAEGFAVPFNGLRATNRQARLRVATSWVAIALPSTLRKQPLLPRAARQNNCYGWVLPMHGSLCQALFEIIHRVSNDVLHAGIESRK